MSDAFQKQHNVKFGIEIEMISPLDDGDFIKVFNITSQQFLLPIQVGGDNYYTPEHFWKIKNDSSIKFLSKDIDDEAFPTKIPKEKFPSHKIISQASGSGYRPGEQMFFPIKKEDPQVTETKLIDRKPSFQAGDEEIKFRKSKDGNKIELISPPLPFDKMHIDQVRWVINILKRMRMKVNASAGIHVHISYNELDLFNFIKMLKNVDEEKIKELWPTRFNTMYTKSKDEVISTVEKHINKLFYEYVKDTEQRIGNGDINNILTVANNVWGRYYGINIKSFIEHGTIEFRYAGSELREKKVIDWLEYIKELVVESLQQTSVEIGEFEITNKNGLLSIISLEYPDQILTSNSIIDQFSMKENAKKSIKLFLQEKNISLYNEDIFANIKQYSDNIQINQKQINAKIKAIDWFMHFIKALLKENVITIGELKSKILFSFTSNMYAYVSKEIINDGIAEISDLVDLSNERFSKSEYNIINAINAKLLNNIPLEDLKNIFIKLIDDRVMEDKIIVIFLKKIYKDNIEYLLTNEDVDVGASIVFMLITIAHSVDNIQNVIGVKLSNEVLLKIFSKENINKSIYNGRLSDIIIFLSKSFSTLSTEIILNNITLEGDKHQLYLDFKELFNSIFSSTTDINKKNVKLLITKLKEITPNEDNHRDIKIINYGDTIINDKLTYDFVVNYYNNENSVTSSVANYILKNKNKFGLFFLIVAYTLGFEDDIMEKIKNQLKLDNDAREETLTCLKRFVKTINISSDKLLLILNKSINDFDFNELLKQEYFNRVRLSENEMLDFLEENNNDDKFEKTKNKELIDLLLGVEENKKHFIKNVPFNMIYYGSFSKEPFNDYIKKTFEKFSNEIDYADFSKKIFKKIFGITNHGLDSDSNKRKTRFLKSITDSTYMPFINIPKLKAGIKEEINENLSDFFECIIENIQYGFKPETKQLIDLLELQNPIFEYLLNDKPDDEKLKSVMVSINNGDTIASILLEKILNSITRSNYGVGGHLNNIKSEALILQILSFANKHNAKSNLGYWLSRFFQEDDKTIDVNFLEMVYSISKNAFYNFIQIIGSYWSDYRLQKYIAKNYNELEKLPLFEIMQKYWGDTILKHQRIVKSGVMSVKWKKTYEQSEEDSTSIANINISFVITDKGNFSFIINSHKLDKFTYGNTYTFIGKDFHEQEKIKSEKPYNSSGDCISVFEDRNPDLLSTSQWKILRSIVDLVMKNLFSGGSVEGFEGSGEDIIRFKKDKQLLLFPDEEEVKPKEDVKEEINYNKRFKEISLTEGIKKAKVFLMKNKDNITDRKLISIIKRMSI